MDKYQMINYVANAVQLGDKAAENILKDEGWKLVKVKKGVKKVTVPAEDRNNDRVVELEHIKSVIIRRNLWIGLDHYGKNAFYWLP